MAQSQKAVPAYFSSKQVLPFGFVVVSVSSNCATGGRELSMRLFPKCKADPVNTKHLYDI